ncbi:hypothetical protein N8996_03345 [Candidatus Poseidonia alphae]|nr:hypothetical protein [Candidatus Poseidonia alphae]
MDNTFTAPVVTVIGTCRVHHSLRDLEKRGLIKLNNGGLASFVHSTPEALLRLKVLLGTEAYLSDIVKLQVGESKEVKLTADTGFDFSESDLLVVEVSTIKAVSINENPLQFNEVNRHLCTPFGEFGKALRKNLNHAFNKRQAFVTLPDIDSPADMPKQFLEFIPKLHPVVMDKDLISSDLNEIRKIAKIPVLLVNHINLPGKDGKLITSRNKLCHIMNDYAKSEGLEIFNPSVMFETHKPEVLLMKGGEDLNHYAKDQLDTVGDIQLKSIMTALR